jgi:hypothetical protein
VEKENAEAKFWLDTITVADNHGFTTRQPREIERIIDEHHAMLMQAWDDFCGGTLRVT